MFTCADHRGYVPQHGVWVMDHEGVHHIVNTGKYSAIQVGRAPVQEVQLTPVENYPGRLLRHQHLSVIIKVQVSSVNQKIPFLAAVLFCVLV